MKIDVSRDELLVIANARYGCQERERGGTRE
jgi:hypothetical protein